MIEKKKNVFPDLINYLYTEQISYLTELPEDKVLPRLKYDNGEIVYLDTDLIILGASSEHETSVGHDDNDTDNDNWELPKVRKLIKALMRAGLCSDVKDLKNLAIPEDTWKKIEKSSDMSIDSLKSFWYCQLHMQLFCPKSIYCNDVKVKLIK